MEDIIFDKIEKERRFKLIYTEQYKSEYNTRQRHLGGALGQNNYDAPEDAIVIDTYDDSKTHSFCIIIAHPSFDVVSLGEIPSRV